EGLPDGVEQAVQALGGLDVLVNNAGGVEQLGTYLDMTVAILENAFRFNVSAPFELGRHAVPHMLARGGGSIVNIGSMSGMQNERGFLPYSLAKSALGKFTQLAAIELAPRIRVNGIHPGCVETEALRGFMDVMPDVRAGLQSKTPMRRNGTPDDIACAALFFAAPASSWITGKLLEVDGAAPAGLVSKESPDLLQRPHVPEDIRFDDEVVIVTGGAGGIGRSQAIELGRRGARVVVNDLGGSPRGGGCDPTMAPAVVGEIRSAGGEAVASGVSVSSEEGPDQIVDAAMDTWGRVDGLIHNAAIVLDDHFEDVSDEDLDSILAVNLRGTFRTVRAVYRAMKGNGGGRIVTLTSASGLSGAFGQAAYATTKMGVLGITRS